MNSVVHFEMPAKDKTRTSQFYSKVFGWKMQEMGQDMGNYLTAQTAPTDDQGMNNTPGTINGGFFDFKDERGYREPHLVISVDDLDQSIKMVEENGGKIIGDKMEIPSIGWYVSIEDTEGNLIGLLQASRS